MLLLPGRPCQFALHRFLKVHFARHNHGVEARSLGPRGPDGAERAAQLGEPLGFGHVAAGGHLGRGRVDAGFGEEGDVAVLGVRHGSVGVLEAGADFGLALVQQVPVVERGHGAGGWDVEGFAGGCGGDRLRHRMDDLVGRSIAQCSAACLWGMSGPNLEVGHVWQMAGERWKRCSVGSGLEETWLAVVWTGRSSVHGVAGGVDVFVTRKIWSGCNRLCTVDAACLLRCVQRNFGLRE